jgi:putative membrane protein
LGSLSSGGFQEGGKEMNIGFPFLKDVLVQWRGYGGYGWHIGPGMMGWGYGMGWFGTILMVVFWIAVIVGIIFLIRWVVVSTHGSVHRGSSEDSPLDILKRRYARGEINKEEFEEKKKDLA